MNWRLTMAITAAVTAIVLIGSVVTRFSLSEMVLLAPVAVVVVGATIGIVLFWIKIVRDLRRG